MFKISEKETYGKDGTNSRPLKNQKKCFSVLNSNFFYSGLNLIFFVNTCFDKK